MNQKDFPFVRKEDLEGIPEEATFETPHMMAAVHYSIDTDGTVQIAIGDADLARTGHWFRKKDLKALRKLLKALEAKLP